MSAAIERIATPLPMRFDVECKRDIHGALPARSIVEAKLYGDARVEIEAQAWVAEGR